MFYQLLVHQVFHTPLIYSPAMEQDKTLVPASSVYAANSVLIDEWLLLDNIIGRNIIDVVSTVTSLVKSDMTEQIIQIECSVADSDLFLLHPMLPRFLELRILVEAGILNCENFDKTTVTISPSVTFGSFDDARAFFYA
jgi:hypothetical protein